MKIKHLLAGLVSLGSAIVWGDYRVEVFPGESLTAARDAVRTARRLGWIAEGECVEVVLRGGCHFLREPLTLTSEDSGDERCPVVWRSANGESAQFRGSISIRVSDLVPVTNPKVRARFPAEVREQVLEISLASAFQTPLPSWDKTFMRVPPAPWAYAGRKGLELARWPNAGAEDLTGPEPQENGWCWFTNAVDRGVDLDAPGALREMAVRPGAIRFKDPRARRWNTAEGVWMYGYWVHDWLPAYQRVGSFDPTSQVVRFADLVKYGVGGTTAGSQKRRFIVINAPEELDAPGEWWFDRKTRTFYCLPPQNEAEIVVALDTQLLTISCGRHMRFENLGFEYTHSEKSVVDVQDSEDVVFSRCSFACHASTGLAISRGSHCRAEDCRFTDMGSTAVTLDGGDRRWLVPARHALVRCDISRYARWNRKAFPVYLRGCGSAVRDSRIHDGPCGAIWYFGNEHLIAGNEIDRVMLEACDAGAIYTGRDPSALGSVIFGNRFSNLGLDPALQRYRSAIYFDDCDWGDDVIGNRICGAGNGVLVGGGSLHGIYNNVFERCLVGVYQDARGWNWKREWRGAFGVDAKTGRGWVDASCGNFAYHTAPWRVAYPTLEDAIAGHPELPRSNAVLGNAFISCPKPYHSWWSRAPAFDTPHLEAGNLVQSDDIDTIVQPIKFKDAVASSLVSPNGKMALNVALDVAGRLSWSLLYNSCSIVGESSLGLTVDNRDFGKKVVPLMSVDPISGTGNFFSACSGLTTAGAELLRENINISAWRGFTVPLADLIVGKIVAWLDVRVWDSGAAYRWRIPGEGRRFVMGEMNTWTMCDSSRVELLESDRPVNWPVFYPQIRTSLVRGVVFPERPRGWYVEGTVVSPWRLTVLKDECR